VGKNLITKNTLNKRALAESSLLYILEDDLITPGAKDLILQKKYRCKYLKREELRTLIREILKNELTLRNLSEEKVSKIIEQVLSKII
jgi:ethanolamine utilization cobalamin adenosyltransferase